MTEQLTDIITARTPNRAIWGMAKDETGEIDHPLASRLFAAKRTRQAEERTSHMVITHETEDEEHRRLVRSV